jgi:GWxTD domain-containing protein
MNQFAAWIRMPMAQALGWTLVHFVWEGGVLAAALWTMLRLFRVAPARRRYALACLTLAAMPAAFAITLAVIWALRPAAVAVPVHWAAAPLADGPIAVSAPRFSWAMVLDRLAWAVPVWAAGVAFFYARGLAGWAAVRRLRSRGVCAPSRQWQARLEQLCVRLGIAKPVALLESCFTEAPVLIGYWRPVILLPLGCLSGLSAAQVECILLHELAHVMRHDYIVNVLQSLVEGLLFYHPAVWWVSRVVRAERENCCDDRVVETMGDARVYAATLAVLEQRRAMAPAAVLAATGGNLMRRIRRLTTESRGAQTSVAPAAAAAVLLAIFAAALTALPTKLPQARHARTPAAMPLAALAVAAPAPQPATAPLPTPYRKWLREDVAYIITDQERTAFLALSSDAERENFIEQFWQRRDPTPGTPENEFRDEHYRRIAYANEHFAGSVAGWKTDRGRTYIVYGPPDELDDHPSGGTASTYPYQQWRYRYIEGVGTNIIVEFVDRDGTGDYQMTSDPSEKEKASSPYRKWLNEDAAYIITGQERAAFLKLASDGGARAVHPAVLAAPRRAVPRRALSPHRLRK